jgi:hypothetical protein
MFFVGEEMFWGNDRLHFVEEALDGAEGSRPKARAGGSCFLFLPVPRMPLDE